MKKLDVGFPISLKENENRRVLIPSDIKYIKNKSSIFIEHNYGFVLGHKDEDYHKLGVNVCSRDEVLQKKIICDPKIGSAEYLSALSNQTIFGWVHAIQNKNVTDILVSNNISAFAWEEMFECGRHVFYRNNEIAGEAAIMHAYLLHGLFPYDTKVAVIGHGNIARGAIKILSNLGANIKVYDRRTEELLRKEIGEFDVIVNAILWDTSRHDHIIYRNDLSKMKKDSMIIDISCDQNGGIESCIPTSIEHPIYYEQGIMHYAVDHTPALFYKTISISLSQIVSKYIDYLIETSCNEVLQQALIIDNGVILDRRIITHQKR